MSVVMVQMIVPKHVLTLMEASLVHVIVVINWTLMGLLVMVSTNMCTIMIITLYLHINTNIQAYINCNIQRYMYTYTHVYTCKLNT